MKNKKTKDKTKRESILSYFKLKKEGKGIDISPKSVNSIPQILPEIEGKPKNKKKQVKQYLSPEFNVIIDNLNKKINSIGKLPTKNIYKKITNNNITNNHESRPIKEITNNNNNTTSQKITSPPEEINKVPVMLNTEELKQNKNTKSSPKQNSYSESNIIDKTESVINNINKTLFTNSKEKTVNINHTNKSEPQNDKTPTINKIQNSQSINNTNNTINKDESNTIKEIPALTEPIVVNNNTKKSNSNHEAVSKVLNRNKNTEYITNKKSYLISTSTINKILSGKVQVPQTIPAYEEGGGVPQKYGGQLIVAGEKENETVIPDSKIGKASKVSVGKTSNETASTAATSSLDKNAGLKMDSDNEKSSGGDAGAGPTVVNATASSADPPSPAPSMGASSKGSESMRAQTMYPRWRQSMG
jgi:hypothetical protein